MMVHFRWVIFISLLTLGCKQDVVPATPTGRTYRMGLQNSAPRYDNVDLIVKSLTMWTAYADAAMITTEVPWDSLLAGKKPVAYVKNNYSGLRDYYSSKNLKLWIYIDPANGLNRASDANALVTAGKSIAQPDIQKMYRRFVVVMDSILKPDHLGLALETNLIRFSSPPAIYQGIKQAAAAAALDVRAVDPSVKLSISVQAETAWGKLQGANVYEGIASDLADFPFLQELGISSYPYFNFNSPNDLPDNYYSRLTAGNNLPVFVSEGGWSSRKSDPIMTCSCSEQQQRDYISRHSQLLDNAKAIGYFQLTFTDLDLTGLPSTVDPTIKYFAYLGLVDATLQPKLAFTIWKELYNRKLK